MSIGRKSIEKPDFAAMERGYWQQTTVARAREDAKMDANYRARREEYRGRLVDLYNRKSQLENDLQSLEASIAYQEQEQDRLARDYEEARALVRAQREKDDLRQQELFAQAREEETRKENTLPKLNGHLSGKGDTPAPAPTAAAPGGWTSINGSRRRSRREDDDEPPADPGNLLGSVYHNPVDESEVNGHPGTIHSGSVRPQPPTAPNGISIVDEENFHNQTRKNGERPLKPKQRHSLPTFTTVVRSPVGKPRKYKQRLFPLILADEVIAAALPELPPMETKSRSPSGRKSLPEGKRSSTPIKEEQEVNDGKEINRENLVIKDNGKIITEPPMYAGIPLEKIHEKHEYWDPEWEPLESIIKPQVDKWKEKHEQLKNTPEAVRHSIFLANRQINRGQQILDFLKNETVNFHPYQFVGKEMMSKFYKTLVNYDTMFRLANIHEELKKFELDVTPLEWLRQRMYEVAEAQGDKFNLSKYTHDLYHDAKLKALREKHGFGNIGRPSGYKLGERDPNKGSKTKVKRESTGTGSVRKKGRRSIGQVDPDGVMPIQDFHQRFQQQPQEILEPVTPRLQKRQRVEASQPPLPPPPPPLPPPPPESEDDLDYEGYTSRDSFSNGRIMHLDWRLYQIKTRALTSGTGVTQYWTWNPDDDMFEHQVLRDVHPKISWGFYRNASDYSLKLADIVEIRYAKDSQKIVVIIKDEAHGDMLAHFKRERTKKRFLAFVKKKMVKLVKTSSDQIEAAWVAMKSEITPTEESDP